MTGEKFNAELMQKKASWVIESCKQVQDICCVIQQKAEAGLYVTRIMVVPEDLPDAISTGEVIIYLRTLGFYVNARTIDGNSFDVSWVGNPEPLRDIEMSLDYICQAIDDK